MIKYVFVPVNCDQVVWDEEKPPGVEWLSSLLFNFYNDPSNFFAFLIITSYCHYSSVLSFYSKGFSFSFYYFQY